MQDYYDIIDRKKTRPFKETVFDALFNGLIISYIVICVAFGILAGINNMDFFTAVSFAFLLCILGFIFFPAMALLEHMPLAIGVCLYFTIYIITLFILQRNKHKPTKKEKMRATELILKQIEFEKRFPDAARLKNEYNEIWNSHYAAVQENKKALECTSPKKINQAFLSGKISHDKRIELLNRYSACEVWASHIKESEEITKELTDRLKQQIMCYIKEFEENPL